MLDYCYADTSAVAHVPFLGKLSRTPIGLLRLANRYEYAISIVEMNGYSNLLHARFSRF